MADKNAKTWGAKDKQVQGCKPDHAKTSIDRLRESKEIMDFLGIDEKTLCTQAQEIETQL